MNKKVTYLIVTFLLIYQSVLASDNIDDLDDSVTVETVDDAVPAIDVPYESPKITNTNKIYLAEHFDDPNSFEKKWIKSKAKKDNIAEEISKYDGEWLIESPQKDGLIGDKGLVLKSKAKHAAISSSLNRPFIFDNKPLIVQYEVIFQDGQECGGAYLKLISDKFETKNLHNFHDKTPYSIMFGPDKCGNDHKLHFIFKHRNPLNGSLEEKHCKKPKERIDETFNDKLPHLYTLILKPDNTFEILVDKNLINSGSLLEDFTPAVNPEKEIDDPNDKKPTDWDERSKIPDPDAVKPDDWDEDAPSQIVDENAVMPDGWLENEPTHIPDPNAKKPDDWDSEMDGEWEPPMIDNAACTNAPGCGPWEPPLIDNPEYKGKWRAPLIENPNYKGKWRPRKIPNPEFFEDLHPFKMQPVSAVGFELWSMSKDILFDNVIVTDELIIAEEWASSTYDKKRQKIARDSVTFWNRMMRAMNYKPLAWFLYSIYCAIPIGFYIWYLYSNVKEESVIQKLANLTNDYPILWGVYILVLSIPVVFVLYLCCRSSTSQNQEQEELKRAATEKKKTDELTEDLIENVDNVNEEIENENDDVDEDEDREKNSGPDDDDEEDEEEQEEKVEEEKDEVSANAEGDSPKVGEGARKRKVRKE